MDLFDACFDCEHVIDFDVPRHAVVVDVETDFLGDVAALLGAILGKVGEGRIFSCIGLRHRLARIVH